MPERTDDAREGEGARATSLPRRIELLFKSTWLRLLVGAKGASRPLPPPDWDARPHRVLLLRYDGVGDLIVTLPLIAAIARAHPSLVLDVLASRSNAPLLDGHPAVHEVLVHDRATNTPATLRRLRAKPYDAVIDCRVVADGVNPHVARLMLATGAPYRIGLGGRHDDWIYTLAARPRRPLAHVIDYMAELAVPFGVSPDAARVRPTLEVSAAERGAAMAAWRDVPGDGLRVLVNLSAGNADRRWPDERFATVLEQARAAHPRAAILVIGLPVDGPSAAQLAESVGGAADTPSLRATLALVATADIVFTPDTAIAHMASCFGRPTVTMLRKGFERWVPYGTSGRNVFGPSPKTLESLDTAPVATAVLDVLAELSRVSAASRPPVDA
ncbi:MAG: hypothetical protein JWL95_2583 [Gemmatimonadetes bacterium]|nr:hypothetical protein [Gemmatimonadota bacterium]